tara:strand:- start:559 stop:846 length:288 start_codon:yes stop_codon:yes gene_type:complete
MNWNKTVIYIGITGDLDERLKQHRNRKIKGFTEKYHTDRLVYYEVFEYIYEAIEREKQVKGWSRGKKLKLIFNLNPKLEDLSAPLANARFGRDDK